MAQGAAQTVQASQTGQAGDPAANLEDTVLLLIKKTRRMIMEMRYGMPVWAPDDLELAAIAKRVARERSKAAVDAIQSAKHLFVNEHDVRAETKTNR